MMHPNLDHALREIPVPDSREARERTKAVALAEARPAAEAARARPWRRIAVAVASTGAAAAFLVAAPAGQSATQWVGDALGLGDDAVVYEITLDDLKDATWGECDDNAPDFQAKVEGEGPERCLTYEIVPPDPPPAP